MPIVCLNGWKEASGVGEGRRREEKERKKKGQSGRDGYEGEEGGEQDEEKRTVAKKSYG